MFGNVKQKAKYYIPVSVKKKLKYCYYAFQDLIGFIKQEKRTAPPRRLNFVGSSNFEEVGNEFLRYFVDYAKIKPHQNILDIGCGIGRMAQPLAGFVNKEGSYNGFDIAQTGISWCQQNITTKYSNFQFKHIDIYNKFYNKKGALTGNDFSFPYSDSQFDFIFATSVFTHMAPEEVLNYFDEIKRTLKPGGKVFITFFLLDDEIRSNMSQNLSTCDFQFKYDDYTFYSHKDNLEAEVGYEKTWLLSQLESRGISHNIKIHPGSWSGKPNPLSYQDIIIAESSSS